MENVTPTKVGGHCPAGTDYADTPSATRTPRLARGGTGSATEKHKKTRRGAFIT